MKQGALSKTSVKRILIALLLIILPILLLIGIDSFLESLDNYSDLEPVWRSDGEGFVFIRWYWKKKNEKMFMELMEANRDGTGENIVYRFEKKLHLFGLRFIHLDEDKRSLVIRLSFKDPSYEFNIRDFIYIIPLDCGKKPEIWELKKESQGDIILAYNNRTALVRRLGHPNKNSILFTDFGEKKCYSFFHYKKEEICDSATLFNEGNSALIVVESSDSKSGVSALLKINKDGKPASPRHVIDKSLITPIYLPEKKKFVSINRVFNESFYLIDEETLDYNTIPNPSPGQEPIFQFSVSPDENYIINSHNNNIYRINISESRSVKLQYPLTKVIPVVQQNPKEPLLLFSDGIGIFSSDIDGGNLKRISKISDKKRIEQNRFYNEYARLRETCFWKLYNFLFGESQI